MTSQSSILVPHSFSAVPILSDLKIRCAEASCRTTIVVAEPIIWVVRVNYTDAGGVLHREDSRFFLANQDMACPTCEGVLGEPHVFETAEDAESYAKNVAREMNSPDGFSRIKLTYLPGTYVNLPE